MQIINLFEFDYISYYEQYPFVLEEYRDESFFIMFLTFQNHHTYMVFSEMESSVIFFSCTFSQIETCSLNLGDNEN